MAPPKVDSHMLERVTPRSSMRDTAAAVRFNQNLVQSAIRKLSVEDKSVGRVVSYGSSQSTVGALSCDHISSRRRSRHEGIPARGAGVAPPRTTGWYAYSRLSAGAPLRLLSRQHTKPMVAPGVPVPMSHASKSRPSCDLRSDPPRATDN